MLLVSVVHLAYKHPASLQVAGLISSRVRFHINIGQLSLASLQGC